MPAYYSAEVISEIRWHDKQYRKGQTIVFEAADLQELRSGGVIGDIKRIAGEVETAVIEATENASKNYRRRPR